MVAEGGFSKAVGIGSGMRRFPPESLGSGGRPEAGLAEPGVLAGCFATRSRNDGFNWTKPKLGIGSWDGSTGPRTSRLAAKTVGPMGLHGASPFIDPEAEPEARYKMFLVRRPRPPEVVEAAWRETSRCGGTPRTTRR